MLNPKSLFLSMGSAIVLMIIFAIASGAATIIESKTSTEAAWYYVYGASWFALIQLLLGINLTYNIFRYNLIDPKKLPSLIFHLGFIVILIGAGITRYLGFEADMHIREKTQSNIVTTKISYLNLTALNDNGEEINAALPLGLSDAKKGFDLKLKIADNEANLKSTYFLLSSGLALKIKLISATLASSSSNKKISSLSLSFETTNSTTGCPFLSPTNL